MSPSLSADAFEGVAIIGMAGRFPGARTLGQFWDNLRNGVESISCFSPDELTAIGFDPAIASHGSFVRAKGVLEDADLFDARAFGYTPAEAQVLDPQHRVFLECGWHALEHAGYDAERYAGSVGVYAGLASNSYMLSHFFSNPEIKLSLGTDKDFLASRLSYKLNLRGPSMVVQTACSTSLVAVCQAAQSLLDYHCDIALAGGVAISVPLKSGHFYVEGGIFSPDGHCRPFDARAQGTVNGNGIGVVVLKRLTDAMADGDRIHAVIRGFAVNNDGAVKVGYTAPSIDGQAQVIAMAQSLAGVSADSIGYVEAHGTATALGDPIEVSALTQAFRATTDRRQFCAIGSVKGNIGHLDTAAGVAGLIKTVLALEHREIPPTPHFTAPNPKIDFVDSPFFVSASASPWPAGSGPRRAGVSSFGIGGTNAHVVLEEAPAREPSGPGREWQVLTLSARTATAADTAAAQLADHLDAVPDEPLADVAYTLHVGRREFEHRRVVVCRAAADAARALRDPRAAATAAGIVSDGGRKVAFVVNGAGPWDADAWLAALAADPETSRLVSETIGRLPAPLAQAVAALATEAAQRPDASAVIAASPLEPILRFIADYARARQWIAWNVRPVAIVDAGAADLLASTLAGLLDPGEALRRVSASVDLAGTAGWPPSTPSSDPVLPCIPMASGTLVTKGDAGNATPARAAVDDALALASGAGASVLLDAGWSAEWVAGIAEAASARGFVAVHAGEAPASFPAAARGAHAIARLWVSGVQVDWAAYHSGERRVRVELPLYPFERQRHWVERPKIATPAAASGRPQIVRESNPANWFYLPSWKRTLRPNASAAAGRPRRWLVFGDRGPLASRVVADLAQSGASVLMALDGRDGGPTGAHDVVIDPLNAADYIALAHDKRLAGDAPIGVAHLWGAAAGDAAGEAHASRAFYSLLFLAKAFGDSAAPIRIVVATTGAHDVNGHETLRPASAMVVGPCRVIPQEYPQVACRHVDLPDDNESVASTGAAFARECLSDAPEPTVAYRRADRFVQVFEPAPLEAVQGPRTARVRDGGVYLVTGGLGNIGLTVGRYLAEAARARLVLVGRTGLPPRDEWARRLAGARDAVTERIRQVQAMEAAGGQVLVLTADVADRDRLQAVVDEAERRFGPLNGVIHAAGAMSGRVFRTIRDLEVTDCEEHFGPKVRGLAALAEVLGSRPLDFCLIASSLSPVLGGLGHAAYASANAVMDVIAWQRSREPDARWISVNWDGWWFGGPDRQGASPLLLSAREGLDAFTRVLSAEGARQIVVSTGSLAARLDQWVRMSALRQPALPGAPSLPALSPRPPLQTEFVAPSGEMERAIAAVWEETLGVDGVGADDNFFELGGDSYAGLQLVARLSARLGTKVPAVSLYEAPTVGTLARLLRDGQRTTAAPAVDSGRVRGELRREAAEGQVRPEQRAGTSDVTRDGPRIRETAKMSAPRPAEGSGRSDVAIIGMSGRFPGARDLETFWQNLRSGVESRTIFSDEELAAQGLSKRSLGHPRFVKSGFTLDDYDQFDAAFFGINPREAELLDPQHRLFLETAWEALEDAGYDSDRYEGAIAVFGGSTFSGYLNSNVFRNMNVMKAVGARQAVHGSVPDYMVTRVSYKLNLRGPCYFVQTACSTSLVAVHLGCQSLASHESDMVLAGGVAVMVPHRTGYVYEEGGMMSPDGVCRAFDARARGTVFGSGVGLVVLKRLSDALADGDRIHAVIKGAAANNDGSLKVGFTAPGVAGQAQVVAEALANAGVPPDTISYIEAHGTGTELGDPIEVAALTRAFRNETDRRHFCAIGSIKPNVGHLDAAAGVSSLIKTTLALQHRELPPTINYETPNPKIDFEDSPFYVNTTLQPWTANGGPRRAGVSSFGFGGTNAHIILEEAPPPEAPGPARSAQLIVLSARTESALDSATERLARHLERHKAIDLADLAYTTQVGRRPFTFRRAIVCGTADGAIDALQGRDSRRAITGQAASSSRSVAFLFPGQGAQYVGMGADLYREERVFRETVDECARLLEPHLGFDLREALYPAEGVTDETSHRLRETATTQASLFVTELALARLWVSWGIEPSACLGHSIGELVAACFTGVLSVGDALNLVALRGRLMESMPRGTMLAVPLDESRVASLLGPGLWLAAVNAPGLCVVSGTAEAIGALAERLARDGVESRPLHTSHAFHSGMMDGAVGPFVEAARRMTFGKPRIPYLSNLTGTWITAADLRDPEYWGRHIRQAVRFSDGVAELLKDEQRVLLEVGPGNTLSGLIRQQARGASLRLVVPSLRHPQEQVSDVTTMIGALGRLWVGGVAVDWPALHADHRRRRVSLPTYPFERQRFWIEPEKFSLKAIKRSYAAVERSNLGDWFHVPSWTRSVVPALPPLGDEAAEAALVFVDSHGVGSRVVARLESRGHRVVVVEPGERFRVIDESRVAIDPASRADYIALIKKLRDGEQLPGLILHAWGLTQVPDPMPDDGTIRGYQDRGFYSLLHLAQAFGDIGHAAPVRLTVLTDGVHEVTGDEPLVPEKATALGPARVIPQEFQNIRVRVVDVRVETEPGVTDSDVDALVAEMLAATPDRDVAYRGGRRWTLGHAPLPLKAAPAFEQVPLRDRGVYLVTGGLGDIGLVLAQHLAEVCKARLVLVGRRGLPERQEWASYVAARGEDDTTSRRIRAVEGLEAAGAEVLVGEADVTDDAAMRAVVEQATARFGRIDGVVHSAGIAGGGMIQLKTREVAAAVLAPKVVGARVLARIFDGTPLDFFALCSSLTAVLGGVGQVDYCGANASLDAFARQYAARTGTRTVSINWNAWREVGMAVDTDVPEDLKDTLKGEMLASGISNADGVEAFRRIVAAAREAQVAVFPFDLHLTVEADQLALMPDDAGPATQGSMRETASAPQAPQHQRPSIATVYVAPRTPAERTICAVWQDLLGIDKVGIEDNFFDLGGHSLLAIRVMARVNEALGADIPVARLYDGLTVAFLAGLVEAPAESEPDDDDEDDRNARRRDLSQRMRQQQRRRVATRR